MLLPYTVTVKETLEDKFTIVFECLAEDHEHAEEQAQNAYPDCVIVNIINEIY